VAGDGLTGAPGEARWSLKRVLPFRPGEIQPVSTPAGEVATTAHFGDYAQMAPAYDALEQWWTGSGRRPAGVSWEVYGDWDDDPAKVRTDIYFLLRPASG
jgi:effector-binding domain-containing protein